MEKPKEELVCAVPVVEAPSNASSAWPFLRDNFSVVSGLAVLGGLALSITFLFSYLSVFDWHLIVFVQYVDVITFGVIAVGVVSGSLALVVGILQWWTALRPLKSNRAKWRRWIIVGCVVAAVFGWNVWSSLRENNGYSHIFDGLLLFLVAIAIAIIILEQVNRGNRPNIRQLGWYAFLFFLATGTCGRWLGHSVLEVGTFDQDVRTKNVTINSAKPIIIMSRFSVFLKDEKLYVVPTSDITELQTSHVLTTIVPIPATSQTSPASSVHSPPLAPPTAPPSTSSGAAPR